MPCKPEPGSSMALTCQHICATTSHPHVCVQQLVSQGQYHPSSNQSMMVRLDIPYLPSQYPPPQLTAEGYICNCAHFYADPCRSEFRKVSSLCSQMT